MILSEKINSNNINKLIGLIYGFVYRQLFSGVLSTGKRFRKSPFSRLLNKRNFTAGNDFDIKFGASISGVNFSCGDNVGLGCGSHIIGSVSMGSNIRIAQNVILVSEYYGLKQGLSFLSQEGTSKGPILVGDDVWIGANSTILSGVTIGDGACIGAGAVVTRNVPINAIVTGNPAVVVKYR